MAVFEKAFAKTIKAEGGYVNNPNDRGGETYMGVTRKNYPNLKLWTIIDDIKKQSTDKKYINNCLKNNIGVKSEVKVIYKHNYWDPLYLDLVNSQRVAEQLFDNAINCGVVATIKLMQKAKNMKVTGKMSNELIDKYGKQSRTK